MPLLIAHYILTITLTQNMLSCLTPEEFEKKVREAGGCVEFVFEDEEKPFKECHASTIVETPNGNFLCAWFGGTKEKNPDVAIWLSKKNQRGWSKPTKIAKVKEEAHWNPVLFRDQKDIVYLFFKVGKDVPSWSTYWMKSLDNGESWSEPVELVPGDIGGRGPVKNKPIITHDGTWVAPASTEVGKWRCFADLSIDFGQTWFKSNEWEIDSKKIKGKGTIQPTLWESANGKLHALMRTTCGRIARSDSEDGGRSWCPVYLTDLPNNNSGIDLVKTDDNMLWLVYNPVGFNWGPRNPLTLAVSKDNGFKWENTAHLEKDEIPISEYSYPAIIKTSKGIAVSYTWKRERIKFWLIPYEVLKKLLN
ncbi:MAG: exo-alpha-sialidase [Candidatus Hydrogenedentes bacterium]|nr:exo-alpha-sialidase [Candidatus Hydrogenedentota bacterium]